VSDDDPTTTDGGAPGNDSTVELARPVSEDAKVIEHSRGMHLDPRQVPMTLMQPAMDAGQPATPTAPAAQASTPEGQSEAK
jgi:hypothetical protein